MEAVILIEYLENPGGTVDSKLKSLYQLLKTLSGQTSGDAIVVEMCIL